MTDLTGLFREFCDALNGELVAIGCNLRVDPSRRRSDDSIMLLTAAGDELGWLPEHADAASIAAFGVILERRCHS